MELEIQKEKNVVGWTPSTCGNFYWISWQMMIYEL